MVGKENKNHKQTKLQKEMNVINVSCCIYVKFAVESY